MARAVPLPADQLSGLRLVTSTMRRILALDGGGVRGIFTLQILARIEAEVRDAGLSLLRLETGERQVASDFRILAEFLGIRSGSGFGGSAAESWAFPRLRLRRDRYADW